MELFRKTPNPIVLFFVYFFSFSIEMHSQEQQMIPIVYQDTVILYSMPLPVIFDASRLKLGQGLTPECPLMKPFIPPMRFADHRLFADVHDKNKLIQETYKYLLNNNIGQIKYTIADFTGKVEPIEKIRPNIFQFLFKVDDNIDYNAVAKPVRYQPKRRYWTYNGNHKIQLTQNYISKNWYKGGVRNFNLLNRHDLSFNYKKDKYQINNFAEWKLYLYTNPNDTIRHGNIGEDMIRIYSDFGIQALKYWFYSSNIEIKTQLFKNFTENSNQAITSAFAPIYLNVGFLGMRYQIEKLFPKVKGKKINFNTDISPVSINYIGVLNKNIEPKRFGIEEGSRHLINYGSSVNAKLIMNFNKYIILSSRFYYFTNYKTVTSESESRLDMPINRYFSTSLYLFVRYDDNKNIKKDPTLGYFQLFDMISFGFNYQW